MHLSVSLRTLMLSVLFKSREDNLATGKVPTKILGFLSIEPKWHWSRKTRSIEVDRGSDHSSSCNMWDLPGCSAGRATNHGTPNSNARCAHRAVNDEHAVSHLTASNSSFVRCFHPYLSLPVTPRRDLERKQVNVEQGGDMKIAWNVCSSIIWNILRATKSSTRSCSGPFKMSKSSIFAATLYWALNLISQFLIEFGRRRPAKRISTPMPASACRLFTNFHQGWDGGREHFRLSEHISWTMSSTDDDKGTSPSQGGFTDWKRGQHVSMKSSIKTSPWQFWWVSQWHNNLRPASKWTLCAKCARAYTAKRCSTVARVCDLEILKGLHHSDLSKPNFSQPRPM